MWIDDLEQRLVSASVGIAGVNLFKHSKAAIPTGNGPFVLLMGTGGSGPEFTHNSAPQPAYEYPGVQVTIIGLPPSSAWTLAETVKRELASIQNEVITVVKDSVTTQTWYRDVWAMNEPQDGGLDDNKRQQVKFNMMGCKRPQGVF